jgi:hypothetical protein
VNDAILEFSEQTDKLIPAYKAALDEMGTLKKNAKNPHFKSTYADLSAVVDTIEEPLSKNGLFYIQAPGSQQDGSTTFTVMVTRIIHATSGQWVQNTLKLKPSKDDPQGAGSAFTYSRRYALQGLCGLAPEDDDGNAASQTPRAPRQAPKETPAQPPQEQSLIPTDTAPQKIGLDVRARFMEFTTKLPPAEVKAIVQSVQEKYGHDQTGQVPDLIEGEGVHQVTCWEYPTYFANNPNVKDLCECITGYFRGQDQATTNIYDLNADEEPAMHRAISVLEASYAAEVEGEIPF